MPPPPTSLWDYFAELPDPRRSQGRRHKLRDILAISLCAVPCGADEFTEIEEFGETRKAWLRQFLELPHGIPSHDSCWLVPSSRIAISKVNFATSSKAPFR